MTLGKLLWGLSNVESRPEGEAIPVPATRKEKAVLYSALLFLFLSVQEAQQLFVVHQAISKSNREEIEYGVEKMLRGARDEAAS